MPKLDLSSASRIKNQTGEILSLKGDGFSWTKSENPFVGIGENYLNSGSSNNAIFLPAAGYIYSDRDAVTPQTTDGGLLGYVRAVHEGTDVETLRGNTSGSTARFPTWDETNVSMVFDGANDNLLSSIQPNNTHQTIMCRFYVEATQTGQYSSLIGSSISSNRAYLSLNYGRISAGLAATGAAGFVTGADLRGDGIWHTAALSWVNDGDVVIHLDGAEVLRTAKSGLTAVYPYAIGGRATTSGTNPTVDMPFHGEISHVLITDQQLTTVQIADIHSKWS